MPDERLEIAIKAINEASKAIREVNKDLGATDTASRKGGASLKKLQDIAGKAAIAGFGVLAAGIERGVTSLIRIERINKQTEAVIKSTGGAAGVTAKEIENMAGALERTTSVEAESIQQGQNMLLTFTSIGNDVFPRATRAMTDMAVAFGDSKTGVIDMQTQAVQLGKALNDPINGVTALRRVGVQLTDTQLKQIKAFMAVNDIASAQGIILTELEKEFGGVAEAAGTTTAGKIEQLKHSIGTLEEKMASGLIPILNKAADAGIRLLNWTDDMNAALDEHKAVVTETFTDYKSYRDELVRAATAAGYTIDAQGRLIQQSMGLGVEITNVVDDTYLMSEALFEASKSTFGLGDSMGEIARAAKPTVAAVEETTNATESLKQQMDTLRTIIDGPLGKADEKYIDDLGKLKDKEAELTKELDKLTASQGGAQSATTSYVDNSKRMGEVRTEIDETREAMDNLQREHDEDTYRFLFNTAAQQLAMDGLTSTEVEALTALGKQWGIYDDTTATAIGDTMGAVTALASDQSIDNFTIRMETASRRTSDNFSDVQMHAEQLGRRIRTIPDVKEVIVNIRETTYRRTEVMDDNRSRSGRQHGGPVVGGQGYAVHPPELFFPNQNGYIMSQSDTRYMLKLLEQIAGGLGRPNVNMTVHSAQSLGVNMHQARALSGAF